MTQKVSERRELSSKTGNNVLTQTSQVYCPGIDLAMKLFVTFCNTKSIRKKRALVKDRQQRFDTNFAGILPWHSRIVLAMKFLVARLGHFIS